MSEYFNSIFLQSFAFYYHIPKTDSLRLWQALDVKRQALSDLKNGIFNKDFAAKIQGWKSSFLLPSLVARESSKYESPVKFLKKKPWKLQEHSVKLSSKHPVVSWAKGRKVSCITFLSCLPAQLTLNILSKFPF